MGGLSQDYRLTQKIMLGSGLIGLFWALLSLPGSLDPHSALQFRSWLIGASVAGGSAYGGAVLAAIWAERRPESLKATAPLCSLLAFASAMVCAALTDRPGFLVPALVLLASLPSLPRDPDDPRL